MPLSGHLFVVQADLTRLAADAFLVPCDTDLNVAGGWRPFLEPGKDPQASKKWFRPPGVQREDGFGFLPDTTKGKTRPPTRSSGSGSSSTPSRPKRSRR